MTTAASFQHPLPHFRNGCSGIIVSTLAQQSLRAELLSVVGFFFGRTTSEYLTMSTDQYRGLVSAAQDEINIRRLAMRLADDRKGKLTEILSTDRIMVQSNLYLRATRPTGVSAQEHVGWHRESFYGPDMAASINLWMPIENVTIDNALQYIPESHLIPDHAIETVQEQDQSVQRFSPGHRIGLLYAPKRIVSGVDLSSPRPFIVTPGEVAIFSGALIHGAAENRSKNIRFSVDFRLIAAENLRSEKQHFASGKSYFEPLST